MILHSWLSGWAYGSVWMGWVMGFTCRIELYGWEAARYKAGSLTMSSINTRIQEIMWNLCACSHDLLDIRLRVTLLMGSKRLRVRVKRRPSIPAISWSQDSAFEPRSYHPEKNNNYNQTHSLLTLSTACPLPLPLPLPTANERASST